MENSSFFLLSFFFFSSPFLRKIAANIFSKRIIELYFYDEFEGTFWDKGATCSSRNRSKKKAAFVIG